DAGENVLGWPTLRGLLGEHGGLIVRTVCGWLGLAPANESKPRAKVIEPYRPFPTEHLPGTLRDFVTHAAAAIGCDAGCPGPTALAVAASLIGNARTVRLKAGWEEPPIVWSVFVGDSGTMKTPAYKAVMRPVYKIQRRLRDEFKQEAATYQKRLAEHKG